MLAEFIFGFDNISKCLNLLRYFRLFHELYKLDSSICHVFARFLQVDAYNLTRNLIKSFAQKGRIYVNFMYNTYYYLINFCRATSGHWFANGTLEK